MRYFAPLVAFCLGFLPALTTAQTKPVDPKPRQSTKVEPRKTDLGFDASKVPPPDPKKGKPVARVLDQYVYPEQLGPKSPAKDKDRAIRLRMLVIGPLFNRLRDREKLTAAQSEIDQFESSLAKAGFEKDRIEDYRGLSEYELYQLEIARPRHSGSTDAIHLWKIERALYQRYHGTVIYNKFRPPMPVEAYSRFLADAERAGAVQFYDKETRDAFFEPFTNVQRIVVPPDKMVFDKPWWLRLAQEREM